MSEKITLTVPTISRPNHIYYKKRLIHLDEWNKAIHTKRVQKILDVGMCLCTPSSIEHILKNAQIRPEWVLGTINDLDTVKDGFLVVNTCGDAAKSLELQIKLGYKAGMIGYATFQQIKAMNSCGHINSYENIRIVGFSMTPPEDIYLLQTKDISEIKRPNRESCIFDDNTDLPKKITDDSIFPNDINFEETKSWEEVD